MHQVEKKLLLGLTILKSITSRIIRLKKILIFTYNF